MREGDIILVDRNAQGLVALSIKLGSKLRYGFNDPDTRYSHAAIVYDATPSHVRIVEATAASGVQLAALAKYDPADYDVVPTHVSEHDWPQVRAYLDTILEQRARYDYVTFVGLSLYALTGTSLCIQRAGTAICSGLVCDALTRAGIIWKRPPYACTPADISAQLQPGVATNFRRAPSRAAYRPRRRRPALRD